jgi:shikimate dehydrogenase
MQLSGHTTPFAVLGHPIGHSLSPVMHNASLRALGMDAVYLAFDVHPDRLMAVLPAMRDMGFGGVNLTVPLKEVACRGLADLDDSARRVGAVNTVQFLPDGTLRGHNTDGYGFLRALQEAFGRGVGGRSLFLLGAGGAGRALAITAAVEGASRIDIADLDTERTARVAGEIRALAPACEATAVESGSAAWSAACRRADLVIQATPVGMKPDDASPLPDDALRSGQDVFDLVYMYPETALMRAARRAGAAAENGLAMLLYQGARAFTIWTGREPDTAAMHAALETSVYGV